MEGWIKLYRQLLESPIFNNEKLLKVWIWCLLKATHKGYEQFVGKQLIYIKAGQFVTGRKRASEELKLKEGTVYDYIKTLEKEKMLSIKSNNKFSIISITNWEKYQVEENESNNNLHNKSTTKFLGMFNNKLAIKNVKSVGIDENNIEYTNNKRINSNFNNKKIVKNIVGVRKEITQKIYINNKLRNKMTTTQHKQEYIYLYYINRYKSENLKSFYEKMRFLREIRNDEKYKELTSDEVDELRMIILGGTNE